MELEDWQQDLQQQLEELDAGKRDSPIAVPVGHPPNQDELSEAAEIIYEAGRAVLELKGDQSWLIAEVV